MNKIFINGQVYTGKKIVSSFVIQDDHFVYVGNNDVALTYKNNDSEIIDLNNKFVCAGFNDSHIHLFGLGQSLTYAKLDEHTSSLNDMYAYLREYVKQSNSNWVVGRGWNQDYFTDTNQMPNKKVLDEICDDRPIFLSRTCGHMVVVNSKALKLAGINQNTVAPIGGEIDFENGLLYDGAISLVKDLIPVPNKAEIEDMLIKACKYLNSLGITSVQSDDYCVFNELDFEVINDVYRKLEKENKLTLRVYEQANLKTMDKIKRFISMGYNTSVGSNMFKIGPLKIVADGSLGSKTAALSIPYNDDNSTDGLLLFTDEQLNEMMTYVDDVGMQIAVHAIGDRCLDQVLSVYKKITKDNNSKRHGIVHCQISRADQLELMKQLNLHCYIQSIFLDYDNHIIKQRVGEDLANTSYNWKTMLNSSLKVSNGSDAPVDTPDVLKSIRCATTRKSLDGCGPYLIDQAFNMKEAIDSYTINSAYASFEENIKGKIKKDYLADFVILSDNPFNYNYEDITDIEILNTYLAGNCIYSK